MIVPASVELKVYSGVVSLVGVVTAVTSATTGAVVSIINALFAPREPDELGEGRVNVASLFKLSLIVALFNENEFEDL